MFSIANPYEKFIAKLIKKAWNRSETDYNNTEPNPDYLTPEDKK